MKAVVLLLNVCLKRFI